MFIYFTYTLYRFLLFLFIQIISQIYKNKLYNIHHSDSTAYDKNRMLSKSGNKL